MAGINIIRAPCAAAFTLCAAALAANDCRRNEPKGGNMRLQILTAAVAVLFSSAAFAFHCPADMKKIDEALAKNPKLSEAQMSEVKKYRSEGEALHKAGKHQESVDTLAKAMKILNVK